jgi:Icc-related predicted phosphoesterase
MKLQIMSDLHIHYPGSRGIPQLIPGVEIVVVAGDICVGLVRAIEILRRAFPAPTEIVMVAGNHELWSKTHAFAEHVGLGRTAAALHGIYLLENDVAVVRGIRFLGATLWSDYDLHGPELREAAMRAAAGFMLDHKRIKWSRDPWERFRPAEARSLHLRSRKFFEEELVKPHHGPTVCISHHAMSANAIAPAFRDEILSAAYASEMQPMIDRFQPDLVVTGHTHYGIDLKRGLTRMLSNPAGYADENRYFDPALVVDLAG